MTVLLGATAVVAQVMIPGTISGDNEVTPSIYTANRHGFSFRVENGVLVTLVNDNRRLVWYTKNEASGLWEYSNHRDVSTIFGSSVVTTWGDARVGAGGTTIYAAAQATRDAVGYMAIVQLPVIGGYVGRGDIATGTSDTRTVGTVSSSFCVSPDENTIVGTNYVGNNELYVWTRTGSPWTRTIKTVSPPAGVDSMSLFAHECMFLDDDTVVVMTPAASVSGRSAQGTLMVFGRNEGGADNWGLRYSFASGNGIPTLSSHDGFGSSVSKSPSGTRVAVGVRRYNGYGGIFFFDLDQATGVLTYTDMYIFPRDAPVSYSGFGAARNLIWLSDDVIAVGNTHVDTGAGTNVGAVHILQQTDGVWAVVQRIDGTVDGQYFGRKVEFYDGQLFASGQKTYTGDTATASIHTFELPECSTSPDCPGGHICTPELTCEVAACDSNYNCTLQLQTNRLGRCLDGTCVDYDAGTCSSVATCDNDMARRVANKNAAGAKKISFTASDVNKTKTAVKEVIDRARQTVTNPGKMKAFVQGTTTGYFASSLLEAFGGTEAELLGHIQGIVCGSAPCDVTRVVGGGRRLQSSGEIAIQVDFDIDESFYNDLVTQDAFSDPAFVTALAAAAGVDPSNVTVTATEATLEVTFIVAEESDGTEPVDAAVLADLQEVASTVDTLAATVATELSIPPESVTIQATDLCADRDCNGRGTCDSATGICTCTDAAYWGINCETSVTCENGGTPRSDVAYCACEYPYFDARCNSTKTACSDGTCGA